MKKETEENQLLVPIRLVFREEHSRWVDNEQWLKLDVLVSDTNSELMKKRILRKDCSPLDHTANQMTCNCLIDRVCFVDIDDDILRQLLMESRRFGKFRQTQHR